MSYMHIENLYKNQTILEFKECYALEKIHGTSAHILYNASGIHFFAGGTSHEEFVNLFDQVKLTEVFKSMCLTDTITVYGEAYGGKLMKMKNTYGDKLRFVAFEVLIGKSWLAVPQSETIVNSLGLEFVSYSRIPATIESFNAERDKPSVQAQRNGIIEPKLREGIVLRPIIEVKLNNDNRVIAKYKRNEFMETASPRIINPEKMALLSDANKIAQEWVTPMRLQHVLDGTGIPLGVENLGKIIPAITDDINREAKDEIIMSKESIQAIGRETALLVKRMVAGVMKEK